MRKRLLAMTAPLALLAAGPAFAQDQDEPELVGGSVKTGFSVAVPPMPAGAGASLATGRDISSVIAADLRSTGAVNPIGPGGLPSYSFGEATAPDFGKWRGAGATALISGYVENRGDGRLTVGCLLYDVAAGRELARQGFAVAENGWRQAAHKCADMVYSRLSGQQPYLDTRIVYVAETGPKNNRVKRIAIMDSDGSNHRYLTQGQATVVTPRFSPDGRHLVYMSYQGRRPRVHVLDVSTGADRLLVPGTAFTFAPRYSADGRSIVFSMGTYGNSDIYVVGANGGQPVRLTTAPGADTSPSFSPDGRHIVFESDRSGSQQLYVMNADGSGEKRISFGGGAFRIGVMSPSGGGQKLLTNSWQDEGPSWAPNGQFVMFHRTTQGSGQAALYAVHIDGGQPRRMPTPVGGSDPSWSPLNN